MPHLDGIILGTAQLGRPYGVLDRAHIRSSDEQLKLVRIAESMGVVALDTSPVYGNAERIIGASGTSLQVHTKCHPGLPVEKSLSLSRQSLQRDFLDVIYLHERLLDGRNVKMKLRALTKHLGDGVGAVGVSIYEVEEFLEALKIPEVSLIQVPVSILDRRFVDSDLLYQAANLGKKVIARSVFLQGLLVTEISSLPHAVKALKPYIAGFDNVSRRLGISRLELSLSYVKNVAGLSGIIVGTSSISELEQVVGQFARSTNTEALDLISGIEIPPWDLVDPRKW